MIISNEYFRICAYTAHGGESIEEIMNAVNIAMITFSTTPTIAWEARRILDLRRERRLNKRLIGNALPIALSFSIGVKNPKAYSLKNRQY